MVVSDAAVRAVSAALGLPRPVARRVSVRRSLPVRARDGVILRTDHYAPTPGPAPTLLIRTPYGRRKAAMVLLARAMGQQGFHVVMQACRGTDGSGGTFEPLYHEREDGLDTIDWLRRQPWYPGRFGMFGASYLGFVQWAVAAEVAEELGAMVAVVTAAQTRSSTYAGGSFSLDTVLTWAELLGAQETPWLARQVELKRGQPRLKAALDHLPLAEADTVATGGPVAFWREWLEHDAPAAGYWDARVFHERIAEVRAPVAMVTGWQDIFLPAQLADYAALRAAGARPSLTVGPWTHGSAGLFGAALREAAFWLREHLAGDLQRPRAAVRVHVAGAGGGWRELPDWPPSSEATPWFLRPGGLLDPAPPALATADRFRYDPADPTPSVGGPLLVAQRAGRRDNRALEARGDVLVYTTTPLAAPVEAVGEVTATIYVQSELDHFDVFVRVCDVDPDGLSVNVCDGLVRVAPGLFPAEEGGVLAVPVALWPVAHRFAAGHRIRVQVSGGAHPRYARNPGTGAPLGAATDLRAGERSVWHSPERPSAIRLPVIH